MLSDMAQSIVENLNAPSCHEIIPRLIRKISEEDLDWVQALALVDEVERLTGIEIFPNAC